VGKTHYIIHHVKSTLLTNYLFLSSCPESSPLGQWYQWWVRGTGGITYLEVAWCARGYQIPHVMPCVLYPVGVMHTVSLT
jgi:hypothetical protein